MTYNYTDFAALYDFEAIEEAIQKLFVTTGADLFVTPPDERDDTREAWIPDEGKVAFFTTQQNTLFQKARPRVSALVNQINPFSNRKIVDANDQLQNDWWRARLTLQVITKADMATHRALRSKVLALAVQIAPLSGSTVEMPVGANAHLDKFEITGCEPVDISIGVMLGQGYYVSPISYNIDFAVKPTAWPGGTQ